MSHQDKESPNTADDALELNKETLQDLDIEPVRPEDVKGGALVTADCAGKLLATQTDYCGAKLSAIGGHVINPG